MQIESLGIQKIPAKTISKVSNFNNRNNTDEIILSSKNKEKRKENNFFIRFKTGIVAAVSSFISAGLVLLVSLKKNQELKNSNEELKTQKEDLENKLANIVLPQNMEQKASEKIDQLNGQELSYVPTEIITKKHQRPNYHINQNPQIEMSQLPEQTFLRNDAVKLVYPQFDEQSPYSFEFPTSKDMKIKYDNREITPIGKTLTTVSESYADSLVWSNDKIARDLLQNFYDGHSQTLDGVKFDVNPNGDGTFKVRLSGLSTYSPEKAILLGESSKKNDSKAAGNYGEGLKMVVLKLLREKGANKVEIGANDWVVSWNFEQNNDLGKKVLAYKLDKKEAIDGNYIEFDTDNIDFIKAIIGSFDRFYHYNNPSFTCPNFENDVIGIKHLPKGEKGSFFIAGQSFEVNGAFDAIDNMSIYIKKKPPLKFNKDFIFDPSRDRISLNKDNLKALGKWVISKENMSKEDAVKLLHSVEEYWRVGARQNLLSKDNNTDAIPFIAGLFDGAATRGDLNIKFPDEKCIADSIMVSQAVADMYKEAGYKLCCPSFVLIGMKSIEELAKESRKHIPLEPTVEEKNKILILQEAIDLFKNILTDENMFTGEELNPKIFIYSKDSSAENDAYNNVAGEAIIENGKSLGFWIDRKYLNEEKFSSVFATALHELTHKFGGDESDIFSYKLTDVLRKVFEAINNNPNIAMRMKILEQAWNMQGKSSES